MTKRPHRETHLIPRRSILPVRHPPLVLARLLLGYLRVRQPTLLTWSTARSLTRRCVSTLC